MSFGMIGMSNVAAPSQLALASSAISTVHGMRDVYQDLATKTAQFLRYDPVFLINSFGETKPHIDGYLEILKRLPRKDLPEGALREFMALYNGSLQGDVTSQRALHPAMLGIANQIFDHRPGWHVASLSKSGGSHLAARSLTDLGPQLLYGYRIVSGSKEVKVQEADPEGITMEGYQVAAETALLKILTESSDYRIILVPGFRSTGKSSHILKHLYETLSEQYGSDAVLKTNIRDRRNGIGTFTRMTRKTGLEDRHLPRFTLIDNTPVLAGSPNAAQRGRLPMCIKHYLEAKPENKIVLFGGTDETTSEQMKKMLQLLGPLVRDPQWAATWTMLSLEAKPLNVLQCQQVLTEDDRGLPKAKRANFMSAKDDIVFCDFVSRRVVPFLGAMRQFALIPRNLKQYNTLPNVKPIRKVKEFETALAFVQGVLPQNILTALMKSQARPEGYEQTESLMTEAIVDLIEYLPQDIEDALEWARESQV